MRGLRAYKRNTKFVWKQADEESYYISLQEKNHFSTLEVYIRGGGGLCFKLASINVSTTLLPSPPPPSFKSAFFLRSRKNYPDFQQISYDL